MIDFVYNSINYKLEKKLTAMNIQGLIKTIDHSTIDGKKQLLTPQAAYKLKTSESIGTLSSICDQNDRSFVVNDGINLHKNQISNGIQQIKFDNQQQQIDMMKYLSQSRQATNKIKTKCIQMSQSKASRSQKSLEKNLVKPGNMPYFNKISHFRTVNDRNQLNCTKFHSQSNTQNSQVSNYITTNIQQLSTKDNQIIHQYPQFNVVPFQQKQLPHEEDPHHMKQNVQQSGSGYRNLINSQKRNRENMNLSESKKYSNSYRYKLMEEPTNNKGNVRQLCKCNCLTKDEVKSLFYQFSQRLNRLESKVMELNQQNKKLKENQQYLKEQAEKNFQALIEVNREKKVTDGELKKQIEEKGQLQKLLKDVLSTKDRYKQDNSKQNSFRQLEKNEKKIINFSFINNQSSIDYKPRNSAGRHSQSKLKVQNLLNKLQVRTNKI